MQEKAFSDVLIAMDRIGHGPNSCLGVLNYNGQFTNFTLEDPPRNKKIPKKTAIPAGTYEIKLRHEGELYKKYSKKYGEPHPMLWLQNVEGFSWIYIHPLNFHYQTDGCIGTGDSFIMDGKDYVLHDSVKAYDELYFPTRDTLIAGKQVFIVIREVAIRKRTIRILQNTSLRHDGSDALQEIKDSTGLKLLPTIGAIEVDKDILRVPWYHFYKRAGFKRVASLVVGVGALVLKTAVPELDAVVDLLGLSSGTLFTVGVADSLKKNREKSRDTYVDKNKLLSKIADWIIKIVKFIVNRFTKK
jgi:hypothetical protein